jgi:hypothetical protein
VPHPSREYLLFTTRQELLAGDWSVQHVAIGAARDGEPSVTAGLFPLVEIFGTPLNREVLQRACSGQRPDPRSIEPSPLYKPKPPRKQDAPLPVLEADASGLINRQDHNRGTEANASGELYPSREPPAERHIDEDEDSEG